MAFTQSSRIGAQTQASIEHRLAAREGLVEKLSDLKQEAKEQRVPGYSRMRVAGLTYLKEKGWDQITDDDIAEAMNMR